MNTTERKECHSSQVDFYVNHCDLKYGCGYLRFCHLNVGLLCHGSKTVCLQPVIVMPSLTTLKSFVLLLTLMCSNKDTILKVIIIRDWYSLFQSAMKLFHSCILDSKPI